MRSALIVVDVQGTFADDFPGAGLPVAGSGRTVAPIAAFTRRAAALDGVVAVVTSQDWHPERLPEHMVAAPGGTPDFAAKIFTRHGIAGTPEAELHPGFATPDVLAVVTHRIKKGRHAAAFSAFEGAGDDGRSLEVILRDAGAQRAVVYGWELANCVAETARSAAAAGFETWVIPSLCSVLEPDKLGGTLAGIAANGVRVLAAEDAFAELEAGR